MKVSFLSLLCVATLLTACERPEVTVRVTLEAADGTVAPISGLPVRLLPYDRDAILDSLAAAYPEPRPAPSPEVAATQERVRAALAEWDSARLALSQIRDSVDALSALLTQPETADALPAEEQVRVRRQLQSVEIRERSVNRTVQRTFVSYRRAIDDARPIRDAFASSTAAWERAAYRDFDAIVAVKAGERGAEAVEDTTFRDGTATFQVEPGVWWATASYTGQVDEIYWNVPTVVERGGTRLELDRANALVRLPW